MSYIQQCSFLAASVFNKILVFLYCLVCLHEQWLCWLSCTILCCAEQNFLLNNYCSILSWMLIIGCEIV